MNEKEILVEPGEYKSGQAMVTVSYDELARLREIEEKYEKIAGCFEKGDAVILENTKTLPYFMQKRLQAAAKIAEDSCK